MQSRRSLDQADAGAEQLIGDEAGEVEMLAAAVRAGDAVGGVRVLRERGAAAISGPTS